MRSFAQASRIAAVTGSTLVDALAAQLDDSRTKLRGLRSDAAAWRVLPHLIVHPAVNTRYLMNALSFGEMASLRALDALASRGVLTETSGKDRNRIWQHAGILGALDDYAAQIQRMQVG